MTLWRSYRRAALYPTVRVIVQVPAEVEIPWSIEARLTRIRASIGSWFDVFVAFDGSII